VVVEQRLEPALLLLRRAVFGQDLHVAGVRRRAVEGHRGHDAAAAHLLAEHPVLPVGQAGPVLLVGQKQVPEPFRLRPLAHLHDDRRVGDARPDLLVERLHGLPLDRQHVLVHELADALAEGLDAV
jgi:hypothetical protein